MADSENTELENGVPAEVESSASKLGINVQVNEVSSCERHITITVPREDVNRYFEREYGDLLNTASIPGFRVGKAPRKLIEKRFKGDVSERVKTNLLLDSLTQANEMEDLTPISEPDFDFKTITLPDDGPFVFEYNIEVHPAFDVPNWKGLTLERPSRSFTDDDINRAVVRVRRNAGELVEKDAPAEPGDFIDTKLTFYNEGQVISTSESETICIRPVLSFHDSSIKDFDKLMTGAKAGDTIKTMVRLSVDTPNAFLSGKEVEAVFEIKAIKSLSVPELDDAFLEKIGGFATKADFRDFILDMLRRQMQHEQQQRIRRQITKLLTASANWQLPPRLLERQSNRELQRAWMEMRRSGFDDLKIQSRLNSLRQNIRQVTAQALKEHFILERIAELENIEDTEADYDVEIAMIAAQSNESARRVRAQIEKSGEMDILRNQIIERKVLHLIEEAATFTEVPYEIEGITEEALDLAAGSATEEEIPEVSDEEAKEVARAEAEKATSKPATK
ncbi:MAG: trigger factor [Planctomycetia bacterium]|nr:trigger factor [Planctomycetia bacterium]